MCGIIQAGLFGLVGQSSSGFLDSRGQSDWFGYWPALEYLPPWEAASPTTNSTRIDFFNLPDKLSLLIKVFYTF